MSLYRRNDPFFDDFEDEFFNHPMIPAFPFYHPAPFYHNRRQNSSDSIEKRLIDFSPKINLSEDENNYYIHADLPGMTKDQVTMEISDNRTFTISGERESFKDSDKDNEDEKSEEGEKQEGQEKKEKKEKKNKKFHMMECSYGKFERSFSIPENADLENIQAKMENGVLEVTFKKVETPKTKKRTIQIQ